MSAVIFPPHLSKGDKIAVISPAGSVEKDQLKHGLQFIQSKGYKAVFGEHVFTRFQHGYSYAGDVRQRVSDLNWALNDPEISAIWTSRGGYGCQHLLPHINLGNFIKNPKWFIGYSDNTVIQSYLLQHGFASVHAQTIKTSAFGVTDESYDLIFDLFKGKLPNYTIENQQFNRKGIAEGQLIGGNLALIYALLGTPYTFDFKDKILFIEDIGEKYYALDRMLTSLELAGVFHKIKGLIIGGMTLMEDENENPAYNDSFDGFAYQLIHERVSKYHFPTLFGLPNGHIYDNRPLIIGAEVRLEVDDQSILSFKSAYGRS